MIYIPLVGWLDDWLVGWLVRLENNFLFDNFNRPDGYAFTSAFLTIRLPKVVLHLYLWFC